MYQQVQFSDQYEDFKDLGAEVIGISSDSVESHQNSQNSIITLFFYRITIRKSGNFGVPSGMFGCFQEGDL
jgi:peroxiredoxin Q/BCP